MILHTNLRGAFDNPQILFEPTQGAEFFDVVTRSRPGQVPAWPGGRPLSTGLQGDPREVWGPTPETSEESSSESEGDGGSVEEGAERIWR